MIYSKIITAANYHIRAIDAIIPWLDIVEIPEFESWDPSGNNKFKRQCRAEVLRLRTEWSKLGGRCILPNINKKGNTNKDKFYYLIEAILNGESIVSVNNSHLIESHLWGDLDIMLLNDRQAMQELFNHGNGAYPLVILLSVAVDFKPVLIGYKNFLSVTRKIFKRHNLKLKWKSSPLTWYLSIPFSKYVYSNYFDGDKPQDAAGRLSLYRNLSEEPVFGGKMARAHTFVSSLFFWKNIRDWLGNQLLLNESKLNEMLESLSVSFSPDKKPSNLDEKHTLYRSISSKFFDGDMGVAYDTFAALFPNLSMEDYLGGKLTIKADEFDKIKNLMTSQYFIEKNKGKSFAKRLKLYRSLSKKTFFNGDMSKTYRTASILFQSLDIKDYLGLLLRIKDNEIDEIKKIMADRYFIEDNKNKSFAVRTGLYRLLSKEVPFNGDMSKAYETASALFPKLDVREWLGSALKVHESEFDHIKNVIATKYLAEKNKPKNDADKLSCYRSLSKEPFFAGIMSKAHQVTAALFPKLDVREWLGSALTIKEGELDSVQKMMKETYFISDNKPKNDDQKLSLYRSLSKEKIFAKSTMQKPFEIASALFPELNMHEWLGVVLPIRESEVDFVMKLLKDNYFTKDKKPINDTQKKAFYEKLAAEQFFCGKKARAYKTVSALFPQEKMSEWLGSP